VRAVLAVALALGVAACSDAADAEAPGADGVAVPGRPGASKTPALVRAARRAYDGAPPVIPHAPFGAECVSCHSEQGLAVEGVGFAPPMPHADTAGLSATSRCTQCHVFRRTEALFRPSTFVGFEQDLRRGPRRHAFAPPRMPHPRFLRENCLACHSGPAAREEIRTDHPERVRCAQCHVPIETGELFARP